MGRNRDQHAINGMYWALMRKKALELGSDGCTKVTEWNRICCLQHDVHYRTGCYWKLRQFTNQETGYQDLELVPGPPISRKWADDTFYTCMVAHSPSVAGRLRARARWLGVRAGGWWAWRQHRNQP